MASAVDNRLPAARPSAVAAASRVPTADKAPRTPTPRLGTRPGTQGGGVASPLLANLFLHYVFDEWMRRNHPDILFERYADDIVCHCRTERQAEHLKTALEHRFGECGLLLHPEKTKVVYCRDSNRRLGHSCTSFDFLGYTFRPRRARNRQGEYFTSFCPAISNKAAKKLRQEVRNWRLQTRSHQELDDLARMFNAKIRGWVEYYGAYYKAALNLTLQQIDRKLVLWATQKHKKAAGKTPTGGALAGTHQAATARSVRALAHAERASWIGGAV